MQKKFLVFLIFSAILLLSQISYSHQQDDEDDLVIEDDVNIKADIDKKKEQNKQDKYKEQQRKRHEITQLYLTCVILSKQYLSEYKENLAPIANVHLGKDNKAIDKKIIAQAIDSCTAGFKPSLQQAFQQEFTKSNIDFTKYYDAFTGFDFQQYTDPNYSFELNERELEIIKFYDDFERVMFDTQKKMQDSTEKINPNDTKLTSKIKTIINLIENIVDLKVLFGIVAVFIIILIFIFKIALGGDDNTEQKQKKSATKNQETERDTETEKETETEGKDTKEKTD